jgi:arginine deiminase
MEEETMKLFISQPMRDKTDEEIKRERADAIQTAKKELGTDDIELIDSFFENAPHDARPLWFLAKSLELLSTADVAYFCEGWSNYRGCRVENTCAREYGIQVMGYEE